MLGWGRDKRIQSNEVASSIAAIHLCEQELGAVLPSWCNCGQDAPRAAKLQTHCARWRGGWFDVLSSPRERSAELVRGALIRKERDERTMKCIEIAIL